MMTATSPATKYWPMASDAMSAMVTSKSALMSNSVASAISASTVMGTPHNSTATHAGSTAKSGMQILAISAIADTTMNATSFFAPPYSSARSRGSNNGFKLFTVPSSITRISIPHI